MKEDDILEDCLNNGIVFASEKHNVPLENAHRILIRFKVENNDPEICHCDCHSKKFGTGIIHFGPCCLLTGELYLNDDDSVDLELFTKITWGRIKK